MARLDEAYIGGRAVGGKKHGLTGRGTKKATVLSPPSLPPHVEPGTSAPTNGCTPLPKMGSGQSRAKQYVRGIDHA